MFMLLRCLRQALAKQEEYEAEARRLDEAEGDESNKVGYP
jgi:hypothetical protein